MGDGPQRTHRNIYKSQQSLHKSKGTRLHLERSMDPTFSGLPAERWRPESFNLSITFRGWRSERWRLGDIGSSREDSEKHTHNMGVSCTRGNPKMVPFGVHSKPTKKGSQKNRPHMYACVCVCFLCLTCCSHSCPLLDRFVTAWTKIILGTL